MSGRFEYNWLCGVCTNLKLERNFCPVFVQKLRFKIEKIQKLPGGWGIMADDITAGILANLVLQASRMMLGW